MDTTAEKFFSPDAPVVGFTGVMPDITDELGPYVFRGADLKKLDSDLKLIGEGKLDVSLPEDTYDYDNHQWESPLGKMIGEVFAEEIE